MVVPEALSRAAELEISEGTWYTDLNKFVKIMNSHRNLVGDWLRDSPKSSHKGVCVCTI